MGKYEDTKCESCGNMFKFRQNLDNRMDKTHEIDFFVYDVLRYNSTIRFLDVTICQDTEPAQDLEAILKEKKLQGCPQKDPYS